MVTYEGGRLTTGHAAPDEARILIVDDEPANVRVLERLLTSRGYRNLRSTTDPFQVLSIWDEFDPHLLLLDLMMPRRDGIQIMSELCASSRVSPETRRPPILVLTADATERAREASLAHGAHDLITKPFDHDEVMGRIDRLLEAELVDRTGLNQP